MSLAVRAEAAGMAKLEEAVTKSKFVHKLLHALDIESV